MNYIKNFSKFLESRLVNNLMESLKTWHYIVLSSIGAEFVNIHEEFKLSKDFKIKELNIMSENIEFFNSLNSLGLRKSSVQSSEDYETFVNKPCRFMMIYKFDSNDLENPEYILFESYNEFLKKWEDPKLYRIKDDIKKFYDRLTSKTIEIQDGDQNFIYITSNGNDWELQNLNKESNIYKRFLRKEELQNILDSRKVNISVI